MKKLTIGRNNACDIIIPDTTDLVSRKQAILTYSWTGKMVLYDTSNNGTYVNGQKLENGKGIKVTRKDKVNFARIADLNWDEVKDPYRKNKILMASCTAVVILLTILLTWWLLQPEPEKPATQEQIEQPATQGATETTVKPQAVEPVKTQPVRKPKAKSKKKSSSKQNENPSPRNVQEKEVNEKSPIVY